MINVLDIAEVILDIVVCRHDFLGSVVTNSGTLYPLETCHCYAIFQTLDAAILPRSICKPAALPKGQIATSGAYL